MEHRKHEKFHKVLREGKTYINLTERKKRDRDKRRLEGLEGGGGVEGVH